jgi:lysophospholipase
MSDAHLFNDLAQGPDGGLAYWIRAKDGVRLRAALWPKGAKGCVVLLPGRTEYIEKYGMAATEFGARGYGVAVLDWRGQGLSDRIAPNPMLGHVGAFADYQLDLAALLAKLQDLGQPGPFHMVSHSMGGAIGLRALMGAHGFKSAAFSAPMWGLQFAPGMGPAARTLAQTAFTIGQGQRFAPGTGPQTYVLTADFAENALTRDPDAFARMKAQASEKPNLTLGGPSLQWLHLALRECRDLAARPSPDIAAFCALGTAEKIVDPAPVHTRMARWPKGRLDLIAQAEHEIMMEIPATRTRFYDAATALFAANS